MSASQEAPVKGLKGLARVREALGMKNAHLADIAGVTPQYISRVCSGSIDCSMKLVRKLASELRVDEVELVGGISDRRFLELKKRAAEDELSDLNNAIQGILG